MSELRAPKQPRRIHPESPANIPLVKQMFADPHWSFVERSLDAQWWYSKVIPQGMAGFNPLLGVALIAKESAISSWLGGDPWGPSRDKNIHDSLMGEVLFAAHDYLHGWAVRAIRALVPALEYGTVRISSKNAEDLAFCHILTEACAVIGLDYWYLATLDDLNDVCDIGTALYRRGLTTHFRESDLREYRRFGSSISIQDRTFFESHAKFYATGELWGIKAAAMTESMITRKWLAHELEYGQQQRIYIREWLAFLSGGRVSYTHEALRAPLSLDAPWKQKLIKELGALLWEKCVEGTPHSGFKPAEHEETWRAPLRTRGADRELDFRFVNLNALLVGESPDVKRLSVRADSFSWFAWQFASRYSFAEFPAEARPLLHFAIERRSPAMVAVLFRGMTPLPPTHEPRDLFFPS